MDKNQKINCTVESCRYNNQNTRTCNLESIVVTPKQGVYTKNADNSECSSYDCK